VYWELEDLTILAMSKTYAELETIIMRGELSPAGDWHQF
jgi:hypothetical protein